ncbi:acyltransferase family protein [Bifidobacterium sp. SMB2]|uniref:Acyltransferase family protein n=1 Tax=Bifidobacterium saimiriisciurei TaxID=2661627 RepID=A0ABX0CGN4_9BIFI|nr:MULTISPECIES: acyltransferase [Bifidobacterium]NEG95339.1 acyltransferase family protein [Bifidobacterium sp. SMB2]NEH11477.1 acyltransferase family protein [Bifidobacterium saimiriisciurei]
MKRQRQDIVAIRALAILLVMFGHSIILYSSSWNVYGTTQSAPVLDAVKSVIDVLQMPLFFSISGFCLMFTMQSGHRIVFIRFVLDKVKRLLVPFLIVGIGWLVPIRLLLGYLGYENKPLPYVLIYDFLIGFDNGHLWFLPSLFLMFIVVGGLIEISALWNKYERLFEGMLIAVAFGLYMTALCVPAITFIPYMGNVCRYFIFFALGFVIHRYEDALHMHSRGSVLAGVLTLLCSCLIIQLTGITKNGIGALVVGAAMVLAMYMVVPDRYIQISQPISKDSLGLYLFHSPLLYISFTFWPNISPWLMVTINFVGFGLCALLLTELIRFLRLGFVIGE